MTEPAAIARRQDNPLGSLRHQILSSFALEATPDQIVEALNALAFAEHAVKQLRRDATEALTEWHEENGSFELNGVRYYLGTARKEKIRELKPAIESALTELGGDFDRFVELLAANALKPGACEKALGEEWRAEHFEKTVVPNPKTGKPRRVPKAVDTKYLPKKTEV